MKEITCVYLDDKKDDLERYGNWIREAWTRLDNGIVMRLEPLSDPAKVASAIARPDTCLFVADLLFGSKKEPLGYHAIGDARRQKPNLGILALSVGNGGTEQKARQSGADDYLSKYYVLEEDVELKVLGAKLAGILQVRNIDVFGHDDVRTTRDGGWSMAALVEHVTEKNLVSLVRQIEPRTACKRLDLKFIRSGLSGAYVIGVVGNDCASEARPRLLLKVSRDAGAMHDELARRKGARWWPAGLLVPFAQDVVVTSGGWSAIAAHLIEGAETLSELVRVANGSIAVSALEMLFGEDGLLRVYRDTTEVRTDRADHALLGLLTVSRRARVERALHEIASLASAHDPFALAGDKVVRTMLDDSKLSDRVKPGLTTWSSHGDLHARNIIYSRAQQRPWLIDAGSITTLPWPCDMARLACDLIIEALDAGDPSYEWDNLHSWMVLTEAFLIDKLPPPTHDESAVLSSLRWLRGRGVALSALAAQEAEWQFRLAVGIEFLRSTYRFDVGMPKRILAYHGATLAIKSALGALAADDDS
jgi:hypothetical protein